MKAESAAEQDSGAHLFAEQEAAEAAAGEAAEAAVLDYKCL